MKKLIVVADLAFDTLSCAEIKIAVERSGGGRICDNDRRGSIGGAGGDNGDDSFAGGSDWAGGLYSKRDRRRSIGDGFNKSESSGF